MSSEWEKSLKRAEDLCVGCQVRFGPGSDVVTGLFLRESGFVREDRCPECHGRLGEPPWSFWKHRRAQGQKTGPRRLDLGFLTDFFKRLDGKDEHKETPRIRYIVALLLLRRRILEEVKRFELEGKEVLIVRLKREEREYEVKDPGLDATAMMSIEEDLARIFNLEGALPPTATEDQG